MTDTDITVSVMPDVELIEIAAEFRKGILGGRSSEGMCFMVCSPLAGLLKFYGLSVDIVEGTVWPNLNHFWLTLADGRVLDPTADQFNHRTTEQMPPVYLGEPAGIHGEPSEALDALDEALDTASALLAKLGDAG